MLLAPADAEQLLVELAPPHEAWPHHCRQVAKVSQVIGTAILAKSSAPALDLEHLISQALVHDIGRAKTHGPLHGWTGFVMLRSRGFAATGRGCITHWLKGRPREEVLKSARWSTAVTEAAFEVLDEQPWQLLDSVLSYADSSVQHTTIVPMAARHQDLLERYGESTWLRRATELAEQHGAEITAALGFPVETLLSPLFGDSADGY